MHDAIIEELQERNQTSAASFGISFRELKFPYPIPLTDKSQIDFVEGWMSTDENYIKMVSYLHFPLPIKIKDQP